MRDKVSEKVVNGGRGTEMGCERGTRTVREWVEERMKERVEQGWKME